MIKRRQRVHSHVPHLRPHPTAPGCPLSTTHRTSSESCSPASPTHTAIRVLHLKSLPGGHRPLTKAKLTGPSQSMLSEGNQRGEGANVLPSPELEREGQRNKTDQNTILLMREYLLNSLYILNESYVRVNMFKALKIGLDTFW